jgi:hypothetical protein
MGDRDYDLPFDVHEPRELPDWIYTGIVTVACIAAAFGGGFCAGIVWAALR